MDLTKFTDDEILKMIFIDSLEDIDVAEGADGSYVHMPEKTRQKILDLRKELTRRNIDTKSPAAIQKVGQMMAKYKRESLLNS